MATWIIGTDGKDRLVGTSASEIIWAKADDDVLLGSNGNDTLNGGEGTDTVSYERTGPVTVTLGSGGSVGTASKRFGGDGDLGITYTDTLSSIENVIGSSHNDTITGNELDNILAGLGGADTIRGGIGNDTIDYGASREAVTIDLRGVTQRGGDAQGDKLYTIENVIGSVKADSITGNDKANILRGGGGNDTLAGFEGADTLDGGEGIDTADYSYTPRTGYFTGVTVNLTTGTASGASSLASGAGGLADGDSLVSIENVIGTGRGDRLTGNEKANVLDGGQGQMDDMLAGLGGADTLIGGQGLRDIADYLASPDRVSINLETNLNRFGHAEGDKLDGIEGVRGSTYGDEIIGDRNWNTLLGDDGNDTLIAGGNRDTVAGGKGQDRLDGGEGADQLVGGPVLILGTNIIDIGFEPNQYDGETDVFVYNSVLDSRAADGEYDTIFLFEKGIDKVDLSAIDANVVANGDQEFEVVPTFTAQAGELVIVAGLGGTAGLGADVDGDALPDFVIFFDLPSAQLTAADLLL